MTEENLATHNTHKFDVEKCHLEDIKYCSKMYIKTCLLFKICMYY